MTTEVSIARAQAPKCYRLHRLRRWRWDAVHYRPVEGQYPGVFDSRLHLTADHGYTFTWLGAAVAAARMVTARKAGIRPVSAEPAASGGIPCPGPAETRTAGGDR